jgi:hypothetical protein
MLDLKQNLYTEEFNFKETRNLRSAAPSASPKSPDIPTSGQISGIEVRLSKAFVIDNKTEPIWPFPGLAKVYLLNIVVSDIADAQVELNLNGFEKIGDKESLAVDRTLFFWKKEKSTDKSPSQIHIMTSLIKSKKGLRDAAAIIAEAKNDEGFKSIATNLGKVLKKASAVGNVSDLVFEIAGVVGKLLGKVEDKPLLTRFQSFTDIAGNFNQLGKTDHPFSNKYAELDYAVFIRDKQRQEEEEA